MEELDEIVKLLERLRADSGCPWDRACTIESLKKDMKSEYEEVIQAIDKKDYENLKEEIGDLVWTLLLMIQIAREEKRFNTRDVLKYTRDKIIRRHPHVFGKEKAETPEDAVRIVKRVKEKERNGLRKSQEKAGRE